MGKYLMRKVENENQDHLGQQEIWKNKRWGFRFPKQRCKNHSANRVAVFRNVLANFVESNWERRSWSCSRDQYWMLPRTRNEDLPVRIPRAFYWFRQAQHAVVWYFHLFSFHPGSFTPQISECTKQKTQGIFAFFEMWEWRIFWWFLSGHWPTSGWFFFVRP